MQRLRQLHAARGRPDAARCGRAHRSSAAQPAAVDHRRLGPRRSGCARASPRASRRRFWRTSPARPRISSPRWHWSGARQAAQSRPAHVGRRRTRSAASPAAAGAAAMRMASRRQGPLTPAGLKAGAFDTIFEGSYADRVVTATRIDVTHRARARTSRGAGTIGIVSNGPSLDLHGTWQDFRWPLVGRGRRVAQRVRRVRDERHLALRRARDGPDRADRARPDARRRWKASSPRIASPSAARDCRGVRRRRRCCPAK